MRWSRTRRSSERPRVRAPEMPPRQAGGRARRFVRHTCERTPRRLFGDYGRLGRELGGETGRGEQIVQPIPGRGCDQEIFVCVQPRHHVFHSVSAPPGRASYTARSPGSAVSRAAPGCPRCGHAPPARPAAPGCVVDGARGAWMSSFDDRGAWMSSNGISEALATPASSVVPRRIASALMRFTCSSSSAVLFVPHSARADDVPDANSRKSLTRRAPRPLARVPSRNGRFTLNQTQRRSADAPVTSSAVERRFEVKRARRGSARFDVVPAWHAICGAA